MNMYSRFPPSKNWKCKELIIITRLFLRRVEVDKYSMMELAKNKIFK